MRTSSDRWNPCVKAGFLDLLECQDGDLNSGHEDFQSFLVSLCLLGFKIEHLYKS
jgi:hypothetical protein